jgi:hypothetical protein
MTQRTASRIRWGRVVAAAVLSELGVFLALGVVILTHRFLIAPGRTAAEYDAFAELSGYYVAPTAAGVATFLAALWAGRKLTSTFVAHGTLVGVVAVILSIAFVFMAEPDERLMYGVSYLLRLVGGYLGGVVSQRMYSPVRGRGVRDNGIAGTT